MHSCPCGGRTGGVGFRKATMRFSDADAFQFEIAIFVAERKPRGQVRDWCRSCGPTECCYSGLIGRMDRSTSEKNMSVPSSLGRFEGRLLASQKHFCSRLRRGMTQRIERFKGCGLPGQRC